MNGGTIQFSTKMQNKFQYWNLYTRQLPVLWRGEYDGDNIIKIPRQKHIIRVVGHKHTLSCMRYVCQVGAMYPDYIFLLYSGDMMAFEQLEFPSNVIPVLQVDNRRYYTARIGDYLRICSEKSVSIPTVSLFCREVVSISQKVKWLLLSGVSNRYVNGSIQSNIQRIPVYVEKYQYARRLPHDLNKRMIPDSLTHILSGTHERNIAV
jgi:hypothetical protein